MPRLCAQCGGDMAGRKASALYCKDACKMAAKRARDRGAGGVAGLAAVVASGEGVPRVLGRLEVAATSRLESVGRVDSELGVAALLLAQRLDAYGQHETGSGMAALMAQYRATMAEATAGAVPRGNRLAGIRGQALTVLQGGAAG